MARIVLTNAYITINSVNLSDHIKSVTLTTSDDIVETTAFGSTARTRIAGLADNSVALEFDQDYAASSVEATINAAGSSLVGTVTAIVVKPNGATTAADNPSFSFNALISEWTPLNGAVGELASASVTWPISGAITKAVA
jgi:IMP cyclohydrolase